MLRLVTGWEAAAEELRLTAGRIVAAKKRFNMLAGWTPAEDTLPERILRQPLPEDTRAQLSPARLRALIEAYNLARGWTAEGWIDDADATLA
jgi:aldehyde:ferredoxin oxidoreductase